MMSPAEDQHQTGSIAILSDVGEELVRSQPSLEDNKQAVDAWEEVSFPSVTLPLVMCILVGGPPLMPMQAALTAWVENKTIREEAC